MMITTEHSIALLALLSYFSIVHSDALPHTICERNYEKVGAFVEKDARVMPEQLVNDRDPTSDVYDGHRLNWNEFEQSIHSLACRCAEKAKAKGYKVFGLQFYGECWSGHSAEANFAQYGPADSSQSYQFIGNPPPPCNKNSPQECIGGPLINYVYRLKDDQGSPDIDGGYTSWSDWTECSKTCGGGVKGRERSCTNPKPDGNGKDCNELGPGEETAACNTQPCPDPDVDGNWSEWDSWSACSVTCGGGVQVRQRTCDNPAPSGNGKKCEGIDEESRLCSQNPCPVPCSKALDVGIILDESGSVGSSNFKIALGAISDLVSHYSVSSSGTHFGMITYDSNPTLHFTMGNSQYQNIIDLKSKVESIRYNGGWTRTDRALEMAANSLFTTAGGDRSNKPNILIIFTDGKTNRGSKPYPAVLRPLQSKGVRTVAVGIGRGINDDELLAIAMDDPHYIVKVDRFEQLKEKLDVILADSCQDSPPPTPQQGCTADGVPLLGNKETPKLSLSASSYYNKKLKPSYGQLNNKKSGGAWASRTRDRGQYFQIDFGKPVKITQILTQGRYRSNQWVTKYWISYSQNNGVYEPYVANQNKGKKIFTGNKDRNSIKSNKLAIPIYARYLRIHPWNWRSHISMRVQVYGCTKGFQLPVVPKCLSALGLQSGAIKDSRMTSSSYYSSRHRSANGRLYFQKNGRRTGGWSAKSNRGDQWLQIDLGKVTKVRMVGLQGRADANQWVKTFWISYSNDGIFWHNTDIFAGNTNRYTVVRTSIEPPIIGRYIRIHPKQYRSHMSMRAELYGCAAGQGDIIPKIKCLSPLGMRNRNIPAASITASSQYNKYYGPNRSRLNTKKQGTKRGAWSARKNDKKQWLQIKLNKVSKVKGVVTQGRADSNQWVTSFTLQYSQDGYNFKKYKNGEVLFGNKDRNSLRGHILEPPIIARYIRILPKSWYRHISMRVELYGCTTGFPLPPSPKCRVPLGIQKDSIRMFASSEWNSNHGANNGRLHFKKTGRKSGSWSALRNNRHQWLGADFTKVVKITMFATQGRADARQWTKSYKLQYSLDGFEYKTYSVRARQVVFAGNRDQSSVVAHELSKEIFARFVRVVPVTWYRHISMRVEFFGCSKGFRLPPVPVCREALGLQSGLIKDGQMTASSEYTSRHRASNGRLYFSAKRGRSGGWSAKYRNPNQWMQVDFEKPVKITAFATQGRDGSRQRVTKYSLAYSKDGIFWKQYKNRKGFGVMLFNGNSNSYNVKRHMLPKPIIARYIRIQPKAWQSWVSLRAEFYGCRNGFPIPKPPICGEPIELGDWMMSASSYWSSSLKPQYGKIGTKRRGGAWASKQKNSKQWLKVEFDHEMKITGFSTQGRYGSNQWVKSLTLEYSQDGNVFIPYKQNGAIKLFPGNTNRDSIVSHKLLKPIVAIAIRFRPTTWHRHISMRVGLYGCATGKKPANPPCHSPMDVGVVMDRSGSIGRANFKKAQDFVVKMIRHFEYASSGSRFGVIAYSSYARLIATFKNKGNQNINSLKNIVYGIKFTGGGTRTDSALSLANSHLYSSSGGYLNSRPNVLFVFTDGKTNQGSRRFSTVLRPLLSKKVKVIAVGIGSGIDNKELLQIASGHAKNVFHVKDFDQLSLRMNAILKASCP